MFSKTASCLSSCLSFRLISFFSFMPSWITMLDITFLTCCLSVVPFPQTHAHGSLVYLVSLLGSMEHSFHHTLLLEIRALTDRYPSLLGGCGKDIYRMSNSFTAIARLLGRRLEESTTMHCRLERHVCSDVLCFSPHVLLLFVYTTVQNIQKYTDIL